MRDIKERSAAAGGLPPSLERWLGELLGRRDVRLALERGGDRCSRRRAAFGNLGLGEPLSRSDEAPIVRGGLRASLAHCSDVCLAVAAPVAIACDLTVADQIDREVPLSPPDRHLAQLIALHTGERISCATLRVWSARECLRKLGVRYGGPLFVRHQDGHAAIVLTGAGATIASIVSPNALLISVSCAERTRPQSTWTTAFRSRGGTIEPPIG